MFHFLLIALGLVCDRINEVSSLFEWYSVKDSFLYEYIVNLTPVSISAY